MPKIMLSYVNTREQSNYLDMVFDTIDKLMDYVIDQYPSYTSYSIIVLR